MNSGRATLRRSVWLSLACLVSGWVAIGASAQLGSTPASTVRTAETRALWVQRTSLTTPASISALVRAARDHGFNTLLVQVRGRGDAYYRGGVEPLPPELVRAPETFDPLTSVLESAHAAGLRVHAWINVDLISSAVDLPAAREHLVHRHPAWLMVPRDLALDLAKTDPESPAYVGKLARWTRSQSAGVEGLYSSPIVPAAAQYVEGIVRDLTRRYRLDGVHFDYARYPSDRFDYSRSAVREFRASVIGRLTDAARRSLDAQDRLDVLAYPDAFPEDWRAFRVARLSGLIGRLRDAAKEERPSVLVTAAVAPDAREALEHRLQDWRGWLAKGFVDAICPMAYTTESGRFAEQIAAAREAAGSQQVWAGIGAYRLPPQDTIENIRTARRLGAAGVVLFSYDSLVGPLQAAPDYLSVVGRGAFDVASAPAAGSR